MKRADIAKARWIGTAVDNALRYLGEGDSLDKAVTDGMRCVAHEASVGCARLGAATIRAAHANWDAWTAEVRERVRQVLDAPRSTVQFADCRIL